MAMEDGRQVFWMSKKGSAKHAPPPLIFDHQWKRTTEDEPLDTIFHTLNTGQKFVKVCLGGNRLGDEGALAVVSATLEVPTVTLLDLYFNQITAVGAGAIASLLSIKDDDEGTTHSISHINLGYNDLGCDGAREMARLLRNQHVVKVLGLSHNDIKNRGAEELREALRQNSTLQVLNLKGNPIDALLVDQVNVALSYNCKVAATNRMSPT
jgi:Ran GTPase-activating protein (RanGAP) involved in mRNA processing and transport